MTLFLTQMSQSPTYSLEQRLEFVEHALGFREATVRISYNADEFELGIDSAQHHNTQYRLPVYSLTPFVKEEQDSVSLIVHNDLNPEEGGDEWDVFVDSTMIQSRARYQFIRDLDEESQRIGYIQIQVSRNTPEIEQVENVVYIDF